MGATARVRLGRRPPQPIRLDLSRPALLQPATRIRYLSAGGRGRGPAPQFPPVALAIDYILPEGFSGPLSLEISNAEGKLVRTMAAGAEAGGGGRGRGRGVLLPVTTRPGHNRAMWDYRWSDGGPLAAPGKYTVRLKTREGGLARTLEVRVDPGVLKDGVTVADLVEQEKFLLKVRDTIAQANRLRAQLQDAMQKAGVPLPPTPGPGESVQTIKYAHPLQAAWARLVTAPGTYEQGMLIDQLSNIARAEGGADQKVGMESRRRLDDLVKELNELEASVRAASR